VVSRRPVRWARSVLHAAALIGVTGAACPPPDPPPPREVSIKPFFKPSCDSICGSTCLACVDALTVHAVDLDGNDLVDPRCHDIHGRWETLCDLSLGDDLVLLDEVPVGGYAVIEVRAYRNRAIPTPDAGVDGGLICTPPEHQAVSCDERTSADLMLWGRSDPLDLSADAGAKRVEVKFECRASCDCLDIGIKAGCPVQLRESACISGTSCAKVCERDQDCFSEPAPCADGGFCPQGALRCDVDAGVCDPSSEGAGMLKPFCASCSGPSECENSLCVGRSGEDGGYCARSCPNNACPRGAKCRPVDNDSVFRVILD